MRKLVYPCADSAARRVETARPTAASTQRANNKVRARGSCLVAPHHGVAHRIPLLVQPVHRALRLGSESDSLLILHGMGGSPCSILQGMGGSPFQSYKEAAPLQQETQGSHER